MSKIETDLNLMLLKLCEDLLPKTKAADDGKIIAILKKICQHLETKSD